MIKNILLLTKISTKNLLEKFQLWDKTKKRINKKSIYVWLLLIVLVAITYLSIQILDILKEYGQMDIFLNAILAIIMIIILMQNIISCMNILYFSKDIDYFLAFPIKTKELLMSRIQTMLNIAYITEGILLLIPLIMYGLATIAGYGYYISIIFVCLLLPVFPIGIVTLFFLIVMALKKQIKHKNLFQSVITLLFISIVIIFEVLFIRSIVNSNANYEEITNKLAYILEILNNTLVVINPLINILEKSNILINILKILGVNVVLYFIIIAIGNKVYIKNILKTKNYSKLKKQEMPDLNKVCNVQSPTKAYIKNEFKGLVGNTTFFLQMVYPAIITIVMIIMIAILLGIVAMIKNQELYDFLSGLSLSSEGIVIIIGIAQILFSFSNISITAISRQGENAVFMKYIPISLYKQFFMKNIPQIFVNTVMSIVLVLAVKMIFSSVSWLNIICILPVCVIVGILNSCLMLIVDIKRPLIHWNSEIEVFKQNGNKIFQYVWTIIVVLVLMYAYNIIKDLGVYWVCLIMFVIFALLLFILDRVVRKQIKKDIFYKNIM